MSFYDSYNGQTVLLGTANLIASGPYIAVGQMSTTGLFQGLHSVTAVFSNSTTFGGSTSNADVVTITDYSLTFAPPSLTLTRGQTGTATLTVKALSGFVGTVVLGCTPPPETETTCTFNPSVLTTSGTSTLTIGTTAPHARSSSQAALRGVGLGVSFAAGMVCLLLPQRRRPALLAVMVLCGLMGATGCGSGDAGTSSTADAGTPLGTQQFTIVTSGADGVTTNRHNVAFQVMIQ